MQEYALFPDRERFLKIFCFLKQLSEEKKLKNWNQGLVFNILFCISEKKWYVLESSSFIKKFLTSIKINNKSSNHSPKFCSANSSADFL